MSTERKDGQQQARIDSVLDAALDALGDDDEDDEGLDEKKKGAVPCETAATNQSGDTSKIMGSEKCDEEEIKTEKKPAGSGEQNDSKAGQKKRPVMGPPPPRPALTDDADAEKMLAGFMQDMMKLEENPEDFLSMIREMESEMRQETRRRKKSPQKTKKSDSSKEAPKTKSVPKRSSPQKTPKSAPTKRSIADGGDTSVEVEEAISNLLESMKAGSIEDSDGPTLEEDNDQDILRQLLQGLESLNRSEDAENGGVLNPDSLMDGIMEQLMSKDLMYEPMKQVAGKFPEWLEKNKSLISEEEFSQRREQNLIFQRIAKTYETEPQNTRKLVQLMQQVQEFGQPPKEIIHEIAPGLEFDSEGVPKMDFLTDPELMKEECTTL